MNDENEEQLYWLTKLHKWVSVAFKTTNPNTHEEKDFYYNGWVVDVKENRIILDDRKLGNTPLLFHNLTLLSIDENKNWEEHKSKEKEL